MSENLKKIQYVDGKKHISYSQFSKYLNCPQSWKLDYIDGKRIYTPSLATCFGTAIHEVIQTYLKSLYVDGREAAAKIDTDEQFYTTFDSEIDKEVKKVDMKYEMADYETLKLEGIEILNEFLSVQTRVRHFHSNRYEFVGIEMAVNIPLINNIEFVASIDIVLKDKQSGKHKIFDFKTSNFGWKQKDQQNEGKYSQILLYKTFYSKLFNIPLEMIEVEFFILKKKLYNNSKYKQERIQTYSPANSPENIAESIKLFISFIENSFTKNGEYNKEGYFPKTPGKDNENCKYCPHLGKNCDGKI